MMRYIAILLSCITTTTLLSGCESMPWMEKNRPISAASQITTDQQVGPFNAIVADGPMDVDLVTQPSTKRTHALAFTGDRDTVGTMVAFVKDGTLHLRNMETVYIKGMPRPRVVVPIGELRAITWNSRGILSGHHLRGRNLKTITVNGGVVNLSGTDIGLRSIVSSGGGKATISNVNAQQTLTIRGSKDSYITLSGSAKAIDVVLSFNGILDARALRVTNGFVNVADVAQAHVNVRHSLNAFATGNSTIYFHQQQPELLNKYLRHASSVLFVDEAA